MNKIINRQGKALAIQVDGLDHAPVIIFSNSLGTDHHMWDEQVAYFKENYKVVRYDTRGHGQSDVIENSTLANLGEDVLDILDALNIAKAHFCGISMGGITGLWLGINAADRFESITVANSAAKIGQAEAWLTRADQVEKEGLADLVKTTHTRWFSESFDYQHDDLAQRTIQSLAATSAQGYAASCRALADADVRADLAEIGIPTLLICGAKDPVTTLQDGEFMQSKIQGSELQSIEASHLSNIECPVEFSQILAKFIA
ncbi:MULTISPECIES: 3-oxoadipate enol-lactonase [unclassified Acinetobacter]|uniref:3-oxoadipate enol-lactonase n=1 Tax=unclassified Acinetobacter TaxID=196816 RepID=UPI002574B560|nr:MULTISPECIES: 3-oxoadipate enol-lactonase [unclassified Acinetobacter]MDM1764498.1 3-oxoadipate enol-lactonase [Acinetobacter sp. 226-1]MDM1767473.1 3-oxoadipate enol-lactonase [Acinetobacter sp. 226-4]